MSKRKLIYCNNDYMNFNDGVIRPLIELHYDMVEFDPDKTYDSTDFVVSTSPWKMQDMQL